MNHATATTPRPRSLDVYDALAGRDVERLVELLDPSITVHVPGTHPLAGTHRGLDGVLAFVTGTTAVTDHGERIEVLDALVGADHEAVYCRVTATRAGRPALDNHTVHLLRFAGDRLAEVWIHNRDDVTVDAFWS